MEEMLNRDYAVYIRDKITINGKLGFIDNAYTYFIISSENKEMIHMEQAALAYFLVEKGLYHTAKPIQNMDGNWFTTYQNKSYMVVQVQSPQTNYIESHGHSLANFHLMNAAYHYEPQNISSYGQWKNLWIHKLTIFENRIIHEAKRKHTCYYRLLMDILPYIIGMSENAIQYIQETTEDYRYDEGDQGTITFQRYDDHLLKPVIWVNDLMYDHPTRDLAEYIRTKLFLNQANKELRSFMDDYQSLRPLSIFSWRLLYGRLIFPITFYDLIEESFFTEKNDQTYFTKMENLIEKQSIYEQNLSSFFIEMGLQHEALHIPVLHWL
ncbi:spore coat protein YutH [Virgibacillus campisalis]|uniref:Spore coat protein YutH n=1 Tax=Virgibacillus alimentarius TaxID=698769 RepID=A0ABS4S8I6_9BACI|nr:spore coat protein YutH [Virgibacillus alimentarius]